jgi:uncharacterized membrane protein HdeD (DUF308 family)
MDVLIPPTVRQARWLIVGGLLVLVLGTLRAVAFFQGGGLIFLVLGTLFLAVGIASVAAAVIRIRRGDPPPADESR